MNTSKVYLEHANITVTDIDLAVKFFKSAFPDFEIRGGGQRMGTEGLRWIHVGNNETYIALNEGESKVAAGHPDYEGNGINHIGFVVEDVAEIAERLEAAGFERDYPKQIQKFRIRDYFGDGDGNQYEFVQYLSDRYEERNTYQD